MDQLRAMLRSLSKKGFDDFLEEIQHDRPNSSDARANNSGQGENDHLQAIIEGMQRQIDQLARGSAQTDDSFEFGSPLSDEIYIFEFASYVGIVDVRIICLFLIILHSQNRL